MATAFWNAGDFFLTEEETYGIVLDALHQAVIVEKTPQGEYKIEKRNSVPDNASSVTSQRVPFLLKTILSAALVAVSPLHSSIILRNR
jgi:hypothetical protein